MVKKIILSVIAIIIFVSIFYFFIHSVPQEETFSVETFLLKSNVPLGGIYEYKINIENNENISKVFYISLERNNDAFRISDDEFMLEPYGQKEVTLFFRDDALEVSVYTSELIVSDGTYEKQIPIIITVEDNKNLLSIIHSTIAEYQNIYPGGKLGLDIKVYDLNDLIIPSLNSKSFIQNIKGDILWTNEKDLVIDGSTTEIVNMPEDWPKGTYVFTTTIDYKGVKSISTYVFTLSKKEILALDLNTNILILIILILILGFASVFFYLIKSRDEFLDSLRKQQHKELSRKVGLIESSKKKLKHSNKSVKKKKAEIKQLKKAEKKMIKKIKRKQSAQRKELKKLRKNKNKREIKKKLDNWKRQGYKMFEGEEDIKDLKDIKNKVKDLKKQGYKI
ncbi:MAG: hypothetical protein P8X70_00390 [Nanoarchaeota archaeon]